MGGSPAVILLSGGLDSATVLAIARNEGYRCFALSIDYGQRHRFELEAAKRVAKHLGAERHVITSIDLRAFGGSALTDDAIEVPKDRIGAHDLSSVENIPPTYVPARNTVFLSLALAFAESIDAFDIFIGANAIDYSGYPDCRPEFIAAFERVANLGTKAGAQGMRLRIHAPLIQMTKAEIIQLGSAQGVDYSLTRSCYDPEPESGAACGRCDSCVLRRRGFEESGVADPTTYATAEAR
jgi:7-cyano-7-deazaguanine synthase